MADTKHSRARRRPSKATASATRGIVWFVVILTVTTLVCQGLMVGLFKHVRAPASRRASCHARRCGAAMSRAEHGATIGSTRRAEPARHDEPGNLQTFREHEDEKLTTYGWIDKNTGVVRIPIDRAKDLLLERGLPVRGARRTATTASTT